MIIEEDNKTTDLVFNKELMFKVRKAVMDTPREEFDYNAIGLSEHANCGCALRSMKNAGMLTRPFNFTDVRVQLGLTQAEFAYLFNTHCDIRVDRATDVMGKDIFYTRWHIIMEDHGALP